MEHTSGDCLTTEERLRRRAVWFSCALWALWTLNIATAILLTVWIFADGLFPFAAHSLSARLSSLLPQTSAAVDVPALGGRLYALSIVSAIGLTSLCGIFAALFFGPSAHRRLTSWLAFTAIVAAWLTLFSAWGELAWQGQKWRVNRQLAAFEPLVASLREHWPTEDGGDSTLGPFMAYPRADPRMLLLLGTSPTLRDTTSVSAVERSDAGVLRFELSAGEQGAWLEWHPPGSRPESFVGGLEGHYQLDRYAPLRNGWFLVRYRALGLR